MHRGDLRGKLRMIKSGESKVMDRVGPQSTQVVLVTDYHELPLAGEYVDQVLSRW